VTADEPSQTVVLQAGLRNFARLEELLGERLFRFPDLPIDQDLAVYRLTAATSGMTCSTDEAARWNAATTSTVEALSSAHRRLLVAHGATSISTSRDGTISCRYGRTPWRLPGWRRRAAKLSRAAQVSFLTRILRALAAYQPVHDEITRRVAEFEAGRKT